MFRTTIRTALGVALALGVVAAPAHADLSSAADPSWVTNGEVKAAARIGTDVYVGGTFDYVGPFTGNGVVLDTANGTRQSGWPTVEGGQVLAAVPDGSGGWFIGGDFDKVGGQSRLNVAHVRSDKTIDSAWNPGTNNVVRAMVVSGGYLYIGGDFTTVAGITGYTRLAALSVTTGVPRNDWTPTASAAVRAMAMATVGGTSYVVITSLTTVNSVSHRRLARVRANDGASDGGWLPGILDDNVNALAIAGSAVYVGGSFDEFDDPNSSTNLERHGLGSFDLSTGDPTTWTVDVGGGFVNALVHDGSRLYAGGGFTTIGATNVEGLAAIDPSSGVVDATWTPDPQVSLGFPNVYALAVQGPNLVVGGSFTSIGGEAHDDLAIVDRANGGVAITAFAPNVMRDENTEVRAVAVAGSDLYAGGDFRSVGGLDRGYLAAFDSDGIATAWNPVADAPVEALAYRGATLYVGGSFATIAGQAHANLAALDTNGSLLPSAAPVANGAVYSMVVDDAAAELVVGGAFTTVEGAGHQRLAAIDLANGHVKTWAPSVDGAVIAIALTSTRAYIGGNFTTVGVSPRPKPRRRSAGLGRRRGLEPAAERPRRRHPGERQRARVRRRRLHHARRLGVAHEPGGDRPGQRRADRVALGRDRGAGARAVAPRPGALRRRRVHLHRRHGAQPPGGRRGARRRCAAVEPQRVRHLGASRGDPHRARQLRRGDGQARQALRRRALHPDRPAPARRLRRVQRDDRPAVEHRPARHHGHGAAREHGQLLQRHVDRLADVVHAAVAA